MSAPYVKRVSKRRLTYRGIWLCTKAWNRMPVNTAIANSVYPMSSPNIFEPTLVNGPTSARFIMIKFSAWVFYYTTRVLLLLIFLPEIWTIWTRKTKITFFFLNQLLTFSINLNLFIIFIDKKNISLADLSETIRVPFDLRQSHVDAQKEQSIERRL